MITLTYFELFSAVFISSMLSRAFVDGIEEICKSFSKPKITYYDIETNLENYKKDSSKQKSKRSNP